MENTENLDNNEIPKVNLTNIEGMFVDKDEDGNEVVGKKCEDESLSKLIHFTPKIMNVGVDFNVIFTRSIINFILDHCSFEGSNTSTEKQKELFKNVDITIHKLEKEYRKIKEIQILNKFLQSLLNAFDGDVKKLENDVKKLENDNENPFDFKKFFTGNK